MVTDDADTKISRPNVGGIDLAECGVRPTVEFYVLLVWFLIGRECLGHDGGRRRPCKAAYWIRGQLLPNEEFRAPHVLFVLNNSMK